MGVECSICMMNPQPEFSCVYCKNNFCIPCLQEWLLEPVENIWSILDCPQCRIPWSAHSILTTIPLSWLKRTFVNTVVDRMLQSDKRAFAESTERYKAAKIRKTEIDALINEKYMSYDETSEQPYSQQAEIRELRLQYQEQHQIVLNYGGPLATQVQQVYLSDSVLTKNPFYCEWKHNHPPTTVIRTHENIGRLCDVLAAKHSAETDETVKNQYIMLINWCRHLHNDISVTLPQFQEDRLKTMNPELRLGLCVRCAAGEMTDAESRTELASYYKNAILTQERCNLMTAYINIGYEIITKLTYTDISASNLLSDLMGLHDYISSIDAKVSMRLKRQSVFPTELPIYLRNPRQLRIEGQ